MRIMGAVLVVGADPDQQQLLANTIARAGYEPVVAPCAQTGVEQLREGGIDLAIVHYSETMQMDVLVGGLERLPDPPPLLMVSASVDAPLASARYGAAGFVAWPSAPDDLMTAVQSLLTSQASADFEEFPTLPTERPD
jgi:DNA-binding NtrC family response regulator